MRIAINTRFLLSNKMEGFGWFTYETSKRMVEAHPEHQFFFFFDRPFDPKFIFASNVTPIVIPPPARHALLFIVWFEIGVRRALKKHKIDAFISMDGYLSLGSKVKQLSVIHDLNFVHNPKDIPFISRQYLLYFFPRFAKKATRIFTVSTYSKQDIVATYGISPDKIDVGHNGANEAFVPISDTEKHAIRNQFSNGKEYILHVGALHKRKNLLRLIEAFNTAVLDADREENLVIVGSALWKSQEAIFTQLSEKAKERILFVGHLPQNELVKVVAGAKLFAYIPYFEGFGIPLVEAMRCGTPVLSGNLTSLPEVGGEAVHYCNPLDVDDISKNLSLLLNDPALLTQLSREGLERSKQFSWNNTAIELWNSLLKVIETKQ
jgi:glycosyltransferase involved in cell wall biosynthesis